MCLSVLLVVMALSGLNVALPAIQDDLSTTGTEIIWIVDSYAIVFAGLLMIAGAMSDKWGRKGALQLGLIGFAVGAVVAASADSAVQVIVGRAVMGAGAAFIMPATLSIITAVFPPEERTKAIAIWAGWAAAGGAIGPVVSGLLIQGWAFVPDFGWGATFLVNVPVVAAVLAAVTVFTPRSRESVPRPLDPVGGVISMAAIVALLFGIIQGPETGWWSGPILTSFAIAIGAVVAFIAWEARYAHPMLPLSLFRSRRFSVGTGAVSLGFCLMLGFFVLLALYLQFVLDYDALETGLANVPVALATLVAAPPSAGLTERLGLGRVLGLGFAIIAVGMLILTTASTATPVATLCIAFVILGVGMALTTAPATGAIMTSVPLDKAGVGSAVNDGSTELGGALGIAVGGSVVTTIYRSRIDFGGIGLSGRETDEASESIGGAFGVASDLDDDTAMQVVTAARDAFADAFAGAMLLGAVVAALGAVAAVWAMHRPAAVR